MAKYTAMIARDVSCYGSMNIEAGTDEHATSQAEAHADDYALVAEMSSAHSSRIVTITNEETGEIIAEDIPLDPCAPVWLTPAERELVEKFRAELSHRGDITP